MLLRTRPWHKSRQAFRTDVPSTTSHSSLPTCSYSLSRRPGTLIHSLVIGQLFLVELDFELPCINTERRDPGHKQRNDLSLTS